MKESKERYYDIVIIGGGFYGCIIALFLKTKFRKILIIEKESNILTRASYKNQARVHNGYHYPRSYITASRSHANYTRFINDFRPAIADNYTMTYAIPAINSRITAQQFFAFSKQIGSPITLATRKIKQFFNNALIEEVFIVEEAVFDGIKLREIIKEKLASSKVAVSYNSEVLKVSSQKNTIKLELISGETINSHIAINCTYANINNILRNSSLTLLPLKHELTEMPLIKVPIELEKTGVTIIDGPFFSIMPFPSMNLHTFHHVRYTPGYEKSDIEDTTNGVFKSRFPRQNSRFIYMIKDAKRFMPCLENAQYKGSLYEVKTVLSQTEVTDARPILFRKDYGIRNFHVVLGGKIDNIYDMLCEITQITN